MFGADAHQLVISLDAAFAILKRPPVVERQPYATIILDMLAMRGADSRS